MPFLFGFVASLCGKSWPHGFSGDAFPHGTVFSR
jgi:hypothetical protein